jgi:2-oxoglutarate ferredoxin oxidoreductase subunit beta
MSALALALQTDRLPVGILYASDEKPSFEETLPVYEKSDDPLYTREPDMEEIRKILEEMK